MDVKKFCFAGMLYIIFNFNFMLRYKSLVLVLVDVKMWISENLFQSTNFYM